MKKGMILYVTEGKEDVPPQGDDDLNRMLASLGVAQVCVAINEPDVSYGCWRLITKGMHQVLLMTANYDAATREYEPSGTPLRLWG